MNDTTRRFLNAVLERVSESRIVEVRLFPAIRQGGIESGIAVLAVEPEPAVPPADPIDLTELTDDAPPELEASAGDEVEVAIEHPADVVIEAVDDIEVDSESLQRIAALQVPDEADIDAMSDATDREALREVTAEGVADLGIAPVADASDIAVELSAAPILADAIELDAEETIALGDILALPSPGGTPHVVGPHRLEILCARYKLVFKGPERGKWDLEIMHQADAPLDTLDRVISGVVRRAGEESEPERFSRESLRTSLDAPVWAHSA
ncbi:MAG: hypothetical protein H7066_19265 [Cytophagaceae bacterium]|nr:hypothetical protein [Gemmatimonadaceae bacterium]